MNKCKIINLFLLAVPTILLMPISLGISFAGKDIDDNHIEAKKVSRK